MILTKLLGLKTYAIISLASLVLGAIGGFVLRGGCQYAEKQVEKAVEATDQHLTFVERSHSAAEARKAEIDTRLPNLDRACLTDAEKAEFNR